MESSDLREVEKGTFRAAFDTGLWDLFIAGFVAIFAIAPLLSGRLGDFWSSAIFLPVWGALYAVLRMVRERVLVPRIGLVRFGAGRKKRLKRFSVVMLSINLLALATGLIAFSSFDPDAGSQWRYPGVLGLVVLVGFSLGAYALNLPRLFLYGVLLAVAPLVGEWLWRRGYASHHGFPITFGFVALSIAVVGLVKLGSIVRHHPSLPRGSNMGQER